MPDKEQLAGFVITIFIGAAVLFIFNEENSRLAYQKNAMLIAQQLVSDEKHLHISASWADAEQMTIELILDKNLDNRDPADANIEALSKHLQENLCSSNSRLIRALPYSINVIVRMAHHDCSEFVLNRFMAPCE